MVAACIAAEQFLSQTQPKSRWSGKEPCPGLSLAPRGAVRAGIQGPLTHTRAPISVCSAWWDLGTPRALQDHTTRGCEGLPGPASLSPSCPPGGAGTQLPIRKESTPALAGRVFQAGNISNSYFFTQVRTKISLSRPSPAAVTDITPATPAVFPGPSPVTALKSWRLQLLLL